MAHQVHLAKKKSIIQNPPNNYSESRLLMDYPFEKLIGGMFLKKDRVFQQDLVQFCGHFF